MLRSGRGVARWIVKPTVAAWPADNIGNPVSQLHDYKASTIICVPASLAQEVGTAPGVQAGEAAITGVLHDAGFGQVRRAVEGAFNMILEARV